MQYLAYYKNLYKLYYKLHFCVKKVALLIKLQQSIQFLGMKQTNTTINLLKNTKTYGRIKM